MPTSAKSNKHTEQNIMNASFDEDFQVSTTELLGYDSSAGVLRRVKVDANGQVATTATLSGDVTTSGEIADGANAAIKATVLDYTNSNPLAVRLTDTSGDYAAAGGGTEYTEGDTDTTITGKAAMMEVASNVLQPVQGTVADGLLVNLGANNDVTVTGSVTANAGTNLNTSALSTSAKQDTLLTELQLKADLTETQPVSLASVPSHAVTNAGTFAVQAAEADGANVTLGSKADAKSTATDTTAVTAMQVLKQISASVQAPPTQAVTGTFYQATQPISAASLPLPTGAATAANQQTDALTDTQLRATAVPVSGTVAVTNAGLTELAAAINASSQMDVNIAVSGATVPVSNAGITTIAGAVSGTEMQVDVVAALPAGTNAIGRVGHDITGIAHGVTTVTTAGTDVALAGSTACKRVTIQAQTDNTGWIAVGATGVDATEATGTGVLLGAGDAFELDIDNLADVFIDSTVNGEGVRYTYFT